MQLSVPPWCYEKVNLPRMARYRRRRYAQSANFALGEGRLFVVYVGVRIPRSQRKEKTTIGVFIINAKALYIINGLPLHIIKSQGNARWRVMRYKGALRP